MSHFDSIYLILNSYVFVGYHIVHLIFLLPEVFVLLSKNVYVSFCVYIVLYPCFLFYMHWQTKKTPQKKKKKKKSKKSVFIGTG